MCDDIDFIPEHETIPVKLKINKIGKYSPYDKCSELDESLCSKCKNKCKDDSMVVGQCLKFKESN